MLAYTSELAGFGLFLLTGAGCIYSRTGSYQTSVSTSDPTSVFPPAKWEPHDNA